MDVYSLKCFLAVVEEQSITRAAKRLFMTQQTLSGIIQRLENECNATLLERKPNIRLTNAGEVVRTYAMEMVKCSNAMENALADVDSNCKTTLHFGISDMRAQAFFSTIWEEFHEKYPNISVALYNGRTDAFYKELATGKINLFLGINAVDKSGTVRHQMAEEWMACIVSLSFLQKYYPELTKEDMHRFLQEGIDPEMLHGLPCIRQRADAGRGTLGFEHMLYNAMIETDLQSTILRMASKGLGFGLVAPCHFFNRTNTVNQDDGDVWIVPLKAKTRPLTLSVIYPDSQQPEYLHDFIRITEKVLKQYGEFAREMALPKTT